MAAPNLMPNLDITSESVAIDVEMINVAGDSWELLSKPEATTETNEKTVILTGGSPPTSDDAQITASVSVNTSTDTEKQLATALKQLREARADLAWADDKLQEMTFKHDAVVSQNLELEASNNRLNARLTEALARLISAEDKHSITREALECSNWHKQKLVDDYHTRVQKMEDWKVQAEDFLQWANETEANIEAAEKRLMGREEEWSNLTKLGEQVMAENWKLNQRLRAAFVVFMNGTYEEGDEHNMPLEWLPRLPRDTEDGSELEYSGAGGHYGAEGEVNGSVEGGSPLPEVEEVEFASTRAECD